MRLTSLDVEKVLVGELNGVLTTHWSPEVNEKTHQFWSHGRFRRRLQEVLGGEYAMSVREVDEVGPSSTCPTYGRQVDRNGDLIVCYDCGFGGHADVAASENLLCKHVGSMARPTVSRENTMEKGHGDVPCLQWDDHRWQRRDHLSETDEEPVNRSTRSERGKLPLIAQVQTESPTQRNSISS